MANHKVLCTGDTGGHLVGGALYVFSVYIHRVSDMQGNVREILRDLCSSDSVNFANLARKTS